MAQYISKSAVVEEIEKRKHKLLDHIICESDKEWVVRTAHQLNRILLFLDTLEVKEVDLEKEIELVKGDYEQVDVAWNNDFDFIARHFFELGMAVSNKAQKGE